MTLFYEQRFSSPSAKWNNVVTAGCKKNKLVFYCLFLLPLGSSTSAFGDYYLCLDSFHRPTTSDASTVKTRLPLYREARALWDTPSIYPKRCETRIVSCCGYVCPASLHPHLCRHELERKRFAGGLFREPWLSWQR